jgi:hypothetical protein
MTRQQAGLRLFVLAWAGVVMAGGARADEIRLKDGKKLYGVIVAYEDNMFKVKTDFGFVLVEKDKIAAIIPTAPAGAAATPKVEPPVAKKPAEKPESAKQVPVVTAVPKKEVAPTSAKTSTDAAKPTVQEKNRAVVASAPADARNTESTGANSLGAAKPAPEKKGTSAAAEARKKSDVVAGKVSPVGTGTATGTPTAAMTAKTSTPVIPTVTAIAPVATKPAPVQPPVNRESVEGNTYVNYTHGFQMYKPPSWKLIDDARKTIPNAIVAMGTSNEATLMIFGEEKSKKGLEETAAEVEARLRDTYGNYRRISQRKTVVGGFPAVEIHYRGLADEHDWSGTLLIVSRSGDMFSIVGMTYADTDLIQIQENVIARAMASLEFKSN